MGASFKAGKEIGHYKIIRKLGAGGMADVYEAEDKKLGRIVALKILPPELMRNEQMVARFQKEVRSAASLNHRSIVTVFEVGEDEDVHYYSMRLLTGGDLRSRISAGLRSVEAIAILRELCGAFEHAHAKGFVHRDVKPENVLFDEEGLPVLTDFGIAKALGSGSQLTGTGVAIGTPRYFSPEQARGRPVDARSDLYSLGVMLYEMLTGAPPYDGEETLSIVLKHVNEPIPTLPEEHAHLQPLLEQLMAKEPDQRIASAKELRKALSGIGGYTGITAAPINLGDESELVQRLLSGEDSAYYTPPPASSSKPVYSQPGRVPSPVPAPKPATPPPGSFDGHDATLPRPAPARALQEGDDDATVRRDAPKRAEPPKPAPGKLFSTPASSSGSGESYVIDSGEEDEDATVRRPPPPRKGTAESAAYKPQVVSPPRPIGAKPVPAAGLPWKPIAAGVALLAGAAVTWVSLSKKAPVAEAPKPVVAAPVATEVTSPAVTEAPAQAAQPAAAALEPPVQASSPAIVQPAPATLAPKLAPATTAKSAPAKAVPATAAPASSKTTAPAAAAVASPAPATAQPAPQPASQPVATPTPQPDPVKPAVVHATPAKATEPEAEPAPPPAPKPKPAEARKEAPKAAPPAEPDAEEDDFLKQRAEQLKLERERREAARKRAAEASARQAPPAEEKTGEELDAE